MDNKMIFSLWAKSEPFQSLPGHMLAAGTVTRVLLRNGTFESLVYQLADELHSDKEAVIAFASYISALHDIGKCHPRMQRTGPVAAELLEPEYCGGSGQFRHEKYTAAVVSRIGRFSGKTNRYIGDILSLHHQGKSGEGEELTGWVQAPLWHQMQDQLEQLAFSAFCPEMLRIEDAHRDAVCTLLLGIVILSDWIASGDTFAELDLPGLDPKEYCSRVETLALTFMESSGLSRRALPECRSFSATWPSIPVTGIRPLQKTVDEYFCSYSDKKPLGILLEAPMGEGKTEAGVYAALKLAEMWDKDGFYIGLPTAATSNQMCSRMNALMEIHHLPHTRLLHAMAWLVDYASLDEPIRTEDEDTARSWTRPLRRGLLAPYAVGTVDQAMMAALAVKYGVLRLTGLACKALILDEVHAYDAYMSDIICRLLQWCRALRIPVVLLSATLPREKRNEIAAVYGTCCDESSAVYPAMTAFYDNAPAETISIPATYQQYSVQIQILTLLKKPGQIAERALESTEDGGCLCVLMNTVAEAQRVYRELKDRQPEGCRILLFHARFAAARRSEIENECVRLFGKDKSQRPTRAILVATQVVEQSMDLDFDRLITAIAPIDLLLQRMGRMHRHRETDRPIAMQIPVMEVLVPDAAAGKGIYGTTERVYPPILLMRTQKLLERTECVNVPGDISRLVETVYSSACDMSEEMEAWAEEMFGEELTRGQARQYELPAPHPRSFSIAEHDPVFDDTEGITFLSARTRLGNDSLRLALVPPELYESVSRAECVSLDLARRVLEYSISVPVRMVSGVREKTDRKGRTPVEGKGLLTGTVILALENGMCSFTDGQCYCEDQEIGFTVRRDESK